MGLIVKRQKWTEVAEQLRPTFGSDEALIKADVDSGLAFCWRVGAVVMITRREGSELVIVCMAGKQLHKVASAIITATKRAGCDSIRFHTQRPALGRFLAPYGFQELERVYRVEL